MANTKIGGMTFCNVKISNKDGNIGNYKLLEVDKPCSPNMTYHEFVAPKRNGSKRYENRYEDLIIKVVIGVSGNTIDRQTKITNLLCQWIGKEDKLIFDDRPNLFYKAKFFKSCTSDNDGVFTKLTITFIASFCMYELLANNSEWIGITANTTKQISNQGNYKAQPIIKLSGVATQLTLKINNEAFSIANLSGIIYIDSENMIVYTMNNNVKVSSLLQFTGVFPTIEPGVNDVVISGTALNLSIIIDFKNTYIV